MSSKGERDEFVLLMVEAQSRLYAYILSLVLDKDRARDILQQTNVVLLEKEAEFQRGTNFAAWAYRVSFYEVLAERRKRQRDKHLFSDELLALVAAKASALESTFDERTAALESCLQTLSQEQRDVVIQRYRPGGSVTALADQLGKTPAAMSAMLYRIRTTLIECVERKMKAAAKP